MGILRTDKLSGLETPTPVTGSVEFDGSGDYLQTPDSEIFSLGTNDYTIEGWFYFTTLSATQRVFGQRAANASELQMMLETNASGELRYYFAISNSSKVLGGSVVTQINTWHHIAVVRKNLVHTLYVDGVSVATNSTDTGTLNNRSQPFSIGREGDYTSDAFNGHISNFRICKGTAVYTTDFTVPTHALEVTQDTVLLCCNNPDSVTASDHGVVGAAPPTLTANGDPTVSSINPSLTRDFTDGTEFRGVTTFDTQGYFVPPSGTTTDRNRTGGRGLIRMADNGISYITISSLGNSQDFGDATSAGQNTSACASSTRGLFSQGYAHPNYYKTIDYVTIASTGNAKDFGDITTSASFIYGMGGCASSTRGLFAGGFTAPSPNAAAGLKQINYVTIASLGDSQDFGDLTGNGVRYPAATSSPTRGVFAGGRDSADAPVFNQNVIHYVTIATLGNALDFGDLSYTPYSAMGTGSSTRGIFTGGYNPAGSAAYNNIEYITISTTGNAQDFGDLTVARGGSAASSNPTRATFAGGNSVPANTNHIDYIAIASTGNALNFGDLLATMSAGTGCSNSHGGLS